MSEDHPPEEHRGQKRKKKRSAAQRLKKFANSRSQGQGTSLDMESYRHMVHIMEVIRTELPQMEDKQTFADNILGETKGKEVDFARNQLASCVLERLVAYASFESVDSLIKAFSPSLRPMCSDKFASHVLEKTIVACCNRAIEPENEKFAEIALKLIKYALNNLEEFVWDGYANYIARTCLECLGGLTDVPEQGKRTKPKLESRKEMPEEFTELLTKTCLRVQKWPQFHEFGHEELTSGFLQSMLYSLKDVDNEVLTNIIQTITEKCFTKTGDEDLSNVFASECPVRLLEVCLAVCGEPEFAAMNKKFFVGKLRRLALTKSTNFAVQKLLEFCPSKEQLEGIFAELEDSLEEILKTGHTGVLSSLANACLNLKSKQGPFLTAISQVLKCAEPEERQKMLVPLCARLRSFDQNERMKNEEGKLQLHLHGSLIVQAMLKFNKPIKVVNSLLGMEANELVALFGDPKGSRILDAFMDSNFVGEKSREKMSRKLKGHWAELACCVHGSR